MPRPRRGSPEQHLGIAFGEEAVAEVFQLCAQFGVVVDGAIEDHRQAESRIDHRLAGRLTQIHDLQASMAEGQRPLAVKPHASGPRAVRC